jgi:hypothetical protein
MADVTPRARNRNGRILHWHQNPPRIPLVCTVCGRAFMKAKSRLRPGQWSTSCSQVCRDLLATLLPPGMRRAST